MVKDATTIDSLKKTLHEQYREINNLRRFFEYYIFPLMIIIGYSMRMTIVLGRLYLISSIVWLGTHWYATYYS